MLDETESEGGAKKESTPPNSRKRTGTALEKGKGEEDEGRSLIDVKQPRNVSGKDETQFREERGLTERRKLHSERKVGQFLEENRGRSQLEACESAEGGRIHSEE